jgi:uncharacterized membrane protein YuzA (DUF378 family)
MLAGRLYIVSIVIVLLAAINLGIVGISKVNVLQYVTFKNEMFLRIVYVIVGLCALYLMFIRPRQTFLSFLEKTVIPPSVFKPFEQQNTNTEVIVDANHAIKVIYWAANKNTGKISDNPYDAYDNFENSGVTNVVNNKATLRFNCPELYQVGRVYKKTLNPHVHYRLVYKSGVISEIFTVKLECKKLILD